MVAEFQKPETTGVVSRDAAYQQSMLSHWPVQLALVPPAVPFLQGADLILTADCVPFAYASLHHDLLRGHALLVACPKLDDSEAHQRNLTDILSHSEVKSLTVVHMEVPCCSSLAHMAKQAIQQSGKDIPFKERTIGIRGDVQVHLAAGRSSVFSPRLISTSPAKKLMRVTTLMMRLLSTRS